METRSCFHHFHIESERKWESSIISVIMSLSPSAFQTPGFVFLMSWPLGGVRGQCQYPSFRLLLWWILPTLSPHTRHLPYTACSPTQRNMLLLILQTHRWGDAAPSDLIRHNSLLLWGTLPPWMSVTVAWGENKTLLCIPQTHPLSNQPISCWDGAGKRRRRRPDEDGCGKSFDLPLGFFSSFLLFCRSSLAGVFQALRNKEMSFFQLLLWSLWVLGWLSFLTECLTLDTLPLFFFLASFRLQPFFFWIDLLALSLLFFPLSTVKQIWIIHFDERYCRVCMPSVLAYVFAWWGHMGCSFALSVHHKSLSFVCITYWLRCTVLCLLP